MSQTFFNYRKKASGDKKLTIYNLISPLIPLMLNVYIFGWICDKLYRQPKDIDLLSEFIEWALLMTQSFHESAKYIFSPVSTWVVSMNYYTSGMSKVKP